MASKTEDKRHNEGNRPMSGVAKDKIKDLTPEDMRDFMYGAIQQMIEGGLPENVAIQYLVPPMPFGPELVAFMDIGPVTKQMKDEGWTVAQLRRAAVNFASIVDHVPLVPSDGESQSTLADINTLISSGRRISGIYKSVLENSRVFNNERSEEDKAELERLRALLYMDVPDDTVPEAETDPLDAIELDEIDDFDLDDVLDDGASLEDFDIDPNAVFPPTKAKAVYDALELNFNNVELAALDAMRNINPNDPNAGRRVKLQQRKIDMARARWEAQGRKTKIQSILARIERLSQGRNAGVRRGPTSPLRGKRDERVGVLRS